MSYGYSLPKTITILGKSYRMVFDTTPDMTGSVATINIGRTFDSDEAAEDWWFYSGAGEYSGPGTNDISRTWIDQHGNITLKVQPR